MSALLQRADISVLLNMLLTLCNNRPDMLICQGIKDGFAFSPALDQAALFEDAQLM